MGSRLGPAPDPMRAPRMLVSALADPGIEGRPGIPLDRVQIVKGWYDAEGHFHQAVHDAVGGPNAASVDLDTCEPRGAGAERLCGVFRDPDFDPAHKAFYYARVLEIPTPRWTTYDAFRFGIEIPEGAPTSTQERAYTSPIWYTP